jgi:tetratricopeptide (TPR) repeat protein
VKDHVICFLLFLFLPFSVNAQKNAAQTLDSLLHALQSEKYQRKQDTDKVNLINKIAVCFEQINQPDESIAYSNKAVQAAQVLNYHKGRAEAYLHIGKVNYAKAEYPAALEYFELALKIAVPDNDTNIIAAGFLGKAAVYYEQGEYEKAVAFSEKALHLFETMGKILNQARCYNTIGNIYVRKGNYPYALEKYFKAIRIFEKSGSKLEMASLYNNIANLYADEFEYQQALQCFDTALKLQKELGNDIEVAGCYVNIGGIYREQGDYPKAMAAFEEVLKILKKNENKKVLAEVAFEIGAVHFKQKQHLAAAKYFLLSLSVAKEIEDKELIAITCNSLGDCYIGATEKKEVEPFETSDTITEKEICGRYLSAANIPKTKTQLLSAAINCYRKTLELEQEMKAWETKKNAYFGLAEAYKLNNDYRNALKYSDSAILIKDSIFSKDKNAKIAVMIAKNDFEKQHLTDSLHHAQVMEQAAFKLEKQKLLLYAIFNSSLPASHHISVNKFHTPLPS